jgi:hypothetical protein
MTFRPFTVIMHAVAVAALLTALSAPRANAQNACQDELAAVQNYTSDVGAAADQVRAAAAAADIWQQQLNDLAIRFGSVVAQLEAKNVDPTLASKLNREGYDVFNEIQYAASNMTDAAQGGANALAASAIYKVALATAKRAYSQCLSAAAAGPAPATDAATLTNIGAAQLINEAESLAKQLLGNNGQAGPTADNSPNTITPNPNQYSVPAGPALPPGQSTSTPASGPTAGNAGNYVGQAIAGMVSALTNAYNAGNNDTNASTASNPPTPTSSVQPSNNGQAGPTAGNSPNTITPNPNQYPVPAGPPLPPNKQTSTTTNTTAATPQQTSCPSGTVYWSCRAPGSLTTATNGCVTPQQAASQSAYYQPGGPTAPGAWSCTTDGQASPSAPTTASTPAPTQAANTGACPTPTQTTQLLCHYDNGVSRAQGADGKCPTVCTTDWATGADPATGATLATIYSGNCPKGSGVSLVDLVYYGCADSSGSSASVAPAAPAAPSPTVSASPAPSSPISDLSSPYVQPIAGGTTPRPNLPASQPNVSRPAQPNPCNPTAASNGTTQKAASANSQSSASAPATNNGALSSPPNPCHPTAAATGAKPAANICNNTTNASQQPATGASHPANTSAASTSNAMPATGSHIALQPRTFGPQASVGIQANPSHLAVQPSTTSVSSAGSGTHSQITLKPLTFGQRPGAGQIRVANTSADTTQRSAGSTQSGQQPSGGRATPARTSGYGKSVGQRSAPRQAAQPAPAQRAYRPARVASAVHTTVWHPSDIRLKEDIVSLGRLANGIGVYCFRYKGNDHTIYVGVMAQEVQKIVPSAVSRGTDGYLRVDYDALGIEFMTWDAWTARTGANAPMAQ